MDNQSDKTPTQEAQQYFYPVEKPKESIINKEQLSAYGNKSRYYAIKAWPTISNLLNFFFFWIKKTIGGIISIGKDQIKG